MQLKINSVDDTSQVSYKMSGVSFPCSLETLQQRLSAAEKVDPGVG